jgi:hypothetical protein
MDYTKIIDTESKPMLGDVPFTDVDGKPIFIDDLIEQTNFNGKQYLAQRWMI